MTRRTLIAAIPACIAAAQSMDLTGTWTAEVNLDQGSGSPSFELKQQGDQLTGKYKGMFGEEPLKGTVKGKEVSFTFRLKQGGETFDVVYEGTLEDKNNMKGKATYGSFASGTWTAKRQ